MASLPNAYPNEQETFPVSLFGRRPTRNSYRAAVKQIVLTIMGQHNLDPEELAERIGVGEDTIKNAAKEANSLEAVTLLNIAFEFGEARSRGRPMTMSIPNLFYKSGRRG
jgi:hypothetical protein